MSLAAGHTYNETRVSVTEEGSGALHSASIPASQEPVPDEAGNPHFVVDFPAVQSGESLHIDVRCLDPEEGIVGTPVTHDVTLGEVPDDPSGSTYPQPVSIYLTT
jgi:hypothetical protein